MKFYFDFYYPNKEKPQFMVSTIADDYKFQFFDNNGEKSSSISLTKEIVENSSIIGGGYTGRQGDAVGIFRQFLNRGK
jgi:hypothetical protein